MNVVELEGRKPDAEYADELRERLKKPLGELTEIISQANRRGIVISFNIATSATGQAVVDRLDVMKKL